MVFPSDSGTAHAGGIWWKTADGFRLKIQSSTFNGTGPILLTIRKSRGGRNRCHAGMGSITFPSLSADTFFTGERHETCQQHVLFEEETLHNLVSGLIRDSDIVIDVSMSVYGLESVNFSSPINSIAAYAANSGCKTYCGVLAEDKDGNGGAGDLQERKRRPTITCFRIKFPHSVIALGKGRRASQTYTFCSDSLHQIFVRRD